MKKFFLTAFLATLGLALPALAQVSASPGDLVLGFRATGGTGQNVNLEVNLGTVAQFQGLASGTTLVLSRLAAADLAATYGSGWATRTDLYWGVVGTAGRLAAGPNGSPIGTLWATNAEGTVGTQSAAWTPGSRGAQFNASSTIEAVLLGAPGSLNGASTTANSSSSSSINATLAGSYTYQDTVQPGTSFAFFNPSIDNSVKADASGYAVSDLYELQPGATSSTYLGSFGLSATGALTFSTSPSFFTGSSGAPTITTQPVAQAVAVGGNATFTVAATGSGTLSYQWYKDGTAISGATSASYAVTGATSANAGNYSVKVTNGSGSITSTGFALTVGSVPNPGRFINLSVLTAIAEGDNFTFGFVVGGAGTSGNKPMLMRAGGPALTQFGYTSAQVVTDPYMEFYHGSTKITQDDDWAGDSSILTTAAAVGAFPYPSTTSKDAAIYVSAVGSGDNSVKISGVGTSAGTMIAELYDSTPLAQFGSATPRLINVSVLKNVGASTTVGFVVGGSTPMNVLVRAVGPTLGTSFSYPGVIADPKLTLYSGQTALGSNDDWGTPVGSGAATGAQLATTFTTVGAFNLIAGSKDAAILTSLAPGDYTVQVTAATGSTGNAIIELYEVP
jgi:hypothetical protein